MTSPRCVGPAKMLLWLSAVTTATACGDTATRILDRVDAAEPPGSTLRLDVLMIRSVTTCAVGNPCVSGANQCFYLEDATGPRFSFAPDGLRFVSPGDPSIATAKQTQCFSTTMNDAEVASATQLLNGLRTEVFQDSGGDINLDVRIHVIAALDSPYVVYKTSVVMDAGSLQTMGLPLVSRDTDFVYAISGFQDPDTGLTPRMDYCVVTSLIADGLVGASPLTWLGLSDRCAKSSIFLASWMVELYSSRKSLGAYPDLYDYNYRNYPACGHGDPDPTRWFPSYNDCTTDPDAPACGKVICPDSTAFYRHMLTKHWQHGQPFNGNYCADGRMDFDETGVDTGGVCDHIGR